MKDIRLIDLFSGIGGIRLGFSQVFGNLDVVLSADIDKNAAKTYQLNFNENSLNDVTKINAAKLPDFDILLGGFPCQAFSLAGKRRGFEDTRGTLFFDVARIIKKKRPKVVFLENVKGLLRHDKGETFSIILKTLENLGYACHFEVLNSKDFGLAQKRERVYIVAFDKKQVKNFANFRFPVPALAPVAIKTILEKNVSIDYFISEQYWKTLKAHKLRHANKGNGFGYQIIRPEEQANTILVGGMGRERNLVIDKSKPTGTSKKEMNKENVRMMTEREWARLQGFPDSYEFPVAKTQRYKQLGNSVSVNVIAAIAQEIKKTLK